MEAVRTISLTKYYGKSRGIKDINLAVPEGDFFGFIGPNGAGKSTTIRTLLGLISPSSGTAEIFGQDIRGHKDKILSDIGYMPSEANFYPAMKVREVIRFSAELRGRDCSVEAARLCERLELDTGKKIGALSLGNRKKVSIVCALQHKPKLCIFDEPTSGLDPLMQTTFFELIREYVNQGATCMLSTHVLPEVKRCCDHVAILKEGQLQCVETVAALTKARAKRIKWVRDGRQEEFLYDRDLNELYRELEGHDITELLIEEPSLEEAFIEYYKA